MTSIMHPRETGLRSEAFANKLRKALNQAELKVTQEQFTSVEDDLQRIFKSVQEGEAVYLHYPNGETIIVERRVITEDATVEQLSPSTKYMAYSYEQASFRAEELIVEAADSGNWHAIVDDLITLRKIMILKQQAFAVEKERNAS